MTAAADQPVTARPATDPALPARARRRLVRLRAGQYPGDPPDLVALSGWEERCSGLYTVIRPKFVLARLTGDRAQRGPRPMRWIIYIWAALAAASWTGSAAGSFWAGCVVFAAALSAPALPGRFAAWTCHRYRDRYVDHAGLDPACRPLMMRAQAAADAAASSAAVERGLVEDVRHGAAWHEWEIATTLRLITQAGLTSAAAQTALESVSCRVDALEQLAAALARADAAMRQHDAGIAEAAGPGSISLDLAAGVAGDGHRISELHELAAASDALTRALTASPAPSAGPADPDR